MSDSNTNGAEWLTARKFLLLLAAALLVIFPKLALGINTLFFRDLGALGYPGVAFLHDSLWHGEFPLWNPYSHCGVPWLAQMEKWYLPGWICYGLPMPWAENFFMLAHSWFGGAGMFWLLRRWKVESFAAAFAAFAFVFNGVSLSCLEWGNYLASLAWLPWVVGSVMETWRKGGRMMAFAAFASAMQVLTGTPEITLLSWLFITLLWALDISSRQVGLVVSIRRVVLVILIASGITMIQMLPFFDLLTHSQRNSVGAGTAAWSMPAWGWANLIMPLFHCYKSPQGAWFQRGQDFIPTYYLGAGVMALAVTGIVAARSRTIAIIAAMAIFCWLMAEGANGFLYEPLKKIFPFIGVARFPVKLTILPVFLVPLLAAWGVERIRLAECKTARPALLIAGTGILILMAALLFFAWRFPFPNDDWHATAMNTLGRAILMMALLAAIFLSIKIKAQAGRMAVQLIALALLPLDAFTHSPKIVPSLPASVLAEGIWQMSGKPPLELGQGRIMVSPNAEQELLYSRVTDMKADFLGKRLAEWYNLNLLDGLPKVTGAITLRPAYFDILENSLYYTRGGHCGEGLVDFLSVAWLSSPANPTEWIAHTNYLPLVTAGQRPIFADDAKTLTEITANDFNPRTTVYLTESNRPQVTITNETTCAVSNINFGLNQVAVDINAAQASLVVLSQSYYHLWQAYVDEKPVPLLRANLAFQAVEVPAGEHRVKWIYRDPYFEAGAVISGLSLALCLFLGCRKTPEL
jgi:hypothetical protein